jgi:phosphatidylserine decarboxylase
MMNAFHELLQKKHINKYDTFYIVNVFHDITWARNTKKILLNLGITKIFFSKKHLDKEDIEQNGKTNAIFPMGSASPKQNSCYNCIFFDSVTTFYNCPFISYYYVDFFTKLSFIPNNNSYTINNLQTNSSFYNTFYYFVKQFTLLSISRYIIYPYAFFLKDPLFCGSYSDYPNLTAYFTRDLTHPAYIDNDAEAMSPCCGIVMDSGDISENKPLFQTIKNETIRLYTNKFTKYINIFLRGNDYHCFHAPISGKIINIEYYQGTRHMLSRDNITVINSSLIENTKIAVHIQNDKEDMLMIIIGGFFVGSINLLIQQDSIVQIGEKIGGFDFGSSILLLHNNSNYHLNNGFVKVFDVLN